MTTGARSAASRAADLLRYWLVFGACLGLLVFRGWDRLAHPELFAEGVRFVGSVLNHGWGSLLVIHDQAFHVAPRLVAMAVVSLAPVADIPFYTNLACYAVFAAVMASVVRPGHRWLIPSDAGRVVLALLLTLAPGMTEILGNLAGLHWSLMLWLGLLTLKDPDQPLTAWELAIAALTLLSSAGAVVFLPMAALRLLMTRRPSASPPLPPALALPKVAGEWVLFGLLLGMFAVLMSSFVTGANAIALEGIDVRGALRGLDDLLPHLGALFTTFYVLHPFLGTQHASLFLVSMPFYPLVGVSLALVSALLYRIWRKMDRRFWLLPAWLACLAGLAVMLSIVRYWAFYGIFSFPYWDWWTRYNFVFACTGLAFWFMLLRPESLHRLRHWSTLATLVLVVAYVSQAGTVTTRAQPPHDEEGYFVARYGDKDRWDNTAEELERAIETGCPRKVLVKGYPGGKWRFTYESPLEVESCPGEGG